MKIVDRRGARMCTRPRFLLLLALLFVSVAASAQPTPNYPFYNFKAIPSADVSESAGTLTIQVVRSWVTDVTSTMTYETKSDYAHTATPGVDYQPVSGTFTFAPGETVKTFTINILPDTIPEPNEEFLIVGHDPNFATTPLDIFILDDDTPTKIGFKTGYNGDPNEYVGAMGVYIERTGNLNDTTTVHYATIDTPEPCSCKHATAGVDYKPVSGTLTFAPGQELKEVVVSILQDTEPEGDEKFSFRLDSPSGSATFVSDTATFTIRDDDPFTTVTANNNRFDVNERAGEFVLPITRFGPTNVTSTVDYATEQAISGSLATPGVDYVATSGTLTFAPGETTKAIHVPILDDELIEDKEYFRIRFSNGTNTRIAEPWVEVGIVNDDEVPVYQWQPAGLVVSEHVGSVTLTLARIIGTSNPSTVSYTTSNRTAIAGKDYTAVSGVLAFARDELTKTITIPIINDSVIEETESFDVLLTGGTGKTPLPAVSIDITDDDRPPMSFVDADLFIYEGAQNAGFRVIMTPPVSHAVTLQWTAAGSGASPATANVDFRPTSGTFTIPANATEATFYLSLIDDDLAEPQETFTVTATADDPSLGTITTKMHIIDDDADKPQSASSVVSVTGGRVFEGNSGSQLMVFPVVLSAPLPTAFDVDYTTVDSTALAGSDYTATRDTLHFAPGELTKSISVPILGDTDVEPDETFAVQLMRPACGICSGYPTISTILATGVIQNDDFASALTVSVADASVTEGTGGTTTLTFPVTLSAAATANVTVNYQTSDQTALAGSDYTAANGTLTFAPGETRKDVVVKITSDAVLETNETFGLTLTQASGANVARAVATGTIVNDDGRFNAAMAVTFASPAGQPLSVDVFTPADGSRFPVILWVPGNADWNAASDRGLVPVLREVGRGFAVAVLDYRSSAAAKFPAQLQDVKAAIRWLRANAARYNLDDTRVAIWGSGAGGHLAALAGTTGNDSTFDDPADGNAAFRSNVQAVIDWSGPTDLLNLGADALSCSTINHASLTAPEARLLGCLSTPCANAATANPATYANAGDAPFLLMHGNADCAVSPQQSARLFDALIRAGVDVTIRRYDGVGHDDPFWSSDAAFAEAERFLDVHLLNKTRTRSVHH